MSPSNPSRPASKIAGIRPLLTAIIPLLPTLAIALLLFVLPLILFGPVSLGGRSLLPTDNLFTFEPYRSAAASLGVERPHNGLLSDLILENYAWKRFIVQALRQGQLPLWNPYLFAGAPFLANGQHSALYPLSAIFYLIPLWRAYGLFTVIQLGLAGLWAYLFARTLGMGRLGALVTAIAYELSGFMLARVVFPMIIAGAAWLPLILAMVERIVRRRPLAGRPASLPWAVIGAIALGCQVLAGHIEILYYTLLITAFYAAWRTVDEGAGEGGSARWWVAFIGQRAAWIGLMVGLGLMLGAVQLLPLYEVVRHNFREGTATLAQVRGWAYPWRRLLAFLVPNFFGNPAHYSYLDLFSGQVVRRTEPIYWGIKNFVEGGAYLGLLTLFLALLGVRGRRVAPFVVLALLSLSFIFGTPLYALIYVLPGMSQIHSPFRWTMALTLSVAVLAGFGAQHLQRTRPYENPDLPPTDRRPPPLLRPFFLDSAPSPITALAGLAFWGGLLTTAGLLLSRAFFPALEPLVDRLFRSLALADTAFPDARAFYSYEFRWLLLFSLLLMAAGIVLRVSRCPIYLPRRLGRRPVWELLALLVLVLDLTTFAWGFYPATDPALLRYEPPVVAFLKQDRSLWRFTTYDPHGKKTFNANVGWFYDLQDVRGYDSIFSAQYRDYMRRIDRQDELEFNRIAPLRHWEALNSPLLDLLNVKYVLTEERIESPKYTLVYEDQALRVYRNEGVAPRAFTLPAGCTVVTEDVAAALRRYDPRHYVILDNLGTATSMEPSLPPEACTPTPATISRYTINEVFVDVTVSEPGAWLVLADSFFPGWRAFVRPAGEDESQEQALVIHRADGNFRAVSLGPGRWTVRFKYSPDSVKMGAFFSFLGGVLIFFLAGLWLWRTFYRAVDETSTVQRVAKNSLAPIVLNLMNRVVDFAFAALMARVLGPEGRGKYAYAVVIFGWLEILTNFGLNTYLMREVARDKARAGHYFVNTTLLRLLLAVLAIPLLALFLLARQSLFTPPLSRDTLLTIFLLFIGLVPGSISVGLSALFQAFEKHEIPAAITSVSTFFKVTLGALVLLLGWGIVGLAGASIVTNLITLAVLSVLALRFFFPGRRLPLHPDWWLQRMMVNESFPLMLNHLLATLFFRVDIILLEVMRNATVVGWYQIAYSGLDALNIIPAFFTFALFPVISRQAREDRKALRATYHLSIKLLVLVALPMAVAMTLLARLFVRILGGSAFLPHSAIALQLMIWSIPFGWINSVTNYLLIALDRQRKLTRAFAIGLAFNIAANLIFIPAYGYRAAAVITIFSELVEGAAFYYYVRRYLGPVPWAGLLWRPAVAALVMGATVMVLGGAPALPVAFLVYPLVALALGVLGPRERAALAPLWGRQS